MNKLAGDKTASYCYAQARDHSRLVRWLRIILPIIATILFLGLSLVSLVRVQSPSSVSVESTMVKNNKIVMKNPRVSGYNRKGVAYSILAEQALYDIGSQYYITLQNIKVSIPIQKNNIAHIVAPSASFDYSKDVLDITVPFTVKFENEIRAEFDSAKLDVKNATFRTERPLSIFSPYVVVFAQSLDVKDNGRVMIFTGNMKMMVLPEAIQGKRSRN